MIRSTKEIRHKIAYRCVFQHHAVDIENAIEIINELVFRCLSTNQAITKAEFDSKLSLYYGYYNSRDDVSPESSLRALIWKHSELTGKYCGCLFWSVKAKSLFDKKLQEYINGGEPTLEDAWQVAKCLSRRNLSTDNKLAHEHVFPIKHLLELLQNPDKHLTYEWVKGKMDLQAIGCVVLESEHGSVPREEGHCSNTWLRYEGKIRLVDNKNWSLSQRKLIEEARLV